MPASSSFMPLSLVCRDAGERQPPSLVSPHGLILTLVLPPLQPLRGFGLVVVGTTAATDIASEGMNRFCF